MQKISISVTCVCGRIGNPLLVNVQVFQPKTIEALLEEWACHSSSTLSGSSFSSRQIRPRHKCEQRTAAVLSVRLERGGFFFLLAKHGFSMLRQPPGRASKMLGAYIFLASYCSCFGRLVFFDSDQFHYHGEDVWTGSAEAFEGEVKALRAVAASLSWIARQCRPDEARTASTLQGVSRAVVKDLSDANRAVNRLKQTEDVGLLIRAIPLVNLRTLCGTRLGSTRRFDTGRLHGRVSPLQHFTNRDQHPCHPYLGHRTK